MRLYSCKIWKTITYEGTPLVRDFIPCKNASGEVGLWDDVNSVFYGNAGTGTFIAGELPALTAHKTLVNGTAYEVKGGKCLVNGTVYSIKKGRTLIDGTGYDIKFSGPQTWILKENPVKNAGMSELVAFESNSLKFKQIEARSENGYFNLIYYYAEKSENITVYSYDEVFEIGSWGAQDYRTITFEEAPTGKLLTWLQANAVQQ